jgi:hypothetical protein
VGAAPKDVQGLAPVVGAQRLARVDGGVENVDAVGEQHPGDLGQQARLVVGHHHQLGVAPAELVGHLHLAGALALAHQAHVLGDAPGGVLHEVALGQAGEQGRDGPGRILAQVLGRLTLAPPQELHPLGLQQIGPPPQVGDGAAEQVAEQSSFQL